jgi:hypothetical protein
MVSEVDDICSFVMIRVIAVFVDFLDAGCQTDCTPFISIKESHLEALAIVRGILLQVRNR